MREESLSKRHSSWALNKEKDLSRERLGRPFKERHTCIKVLLVLKSQRKKASDMDTREDWGEFQEMRQELWTGARLCKILEGTFRILDFIPGAIRRVLSSDMITIPKS